MSWTSTQVVRTQEQWTVTAVSSAGEKTELAYETEAQARYIAAVLSLKPESLPKMVILRALSRLPPPPSSVAKPSRRRRAE
ncbi:MAG: hypothetical protein QM817_36545 [Archangium sp.]